MNTEQIVTAGDFRSFLIALSKGVAAEYKGSLEEYLRALWGVVHHYCRSAVSYSLLGKVILDALTAEPLPFDESWLAYKAPPEALLRDPSLVEDDFESLREMILYQIADLHLMEQAGTLNNPHRYFGIGSPTGHTWYNFHPADFWGNAAYGLEDDSPITECTWADLAICLWLGQIYE